MLDLKTKTIPNDRSYIGESRLLDSASGYLGTGPYRKYSTTFIARAVIAGILGTLLSALGFFVIVYGFYLLSGDSIDWEELQMAFALGVPFFLGGIGFLLSPFAERSKSSVFCLSCIVLLTPLLVILMYSLPINLLDLDSEGVIFVIVFVFPAATVGFLQAVALFLNRIYLNSV